ncbi:MscS Mechanosensitive ion channel [Solidesulfovibrio carbinoliphilus subsp. oakridgensis]|uniref:MscS Mechanosensitive ion channel n=1 Tax=Solidesulfovibrio carbinoliphilus subsp. oakridgensis TaxID=694327 RepID=G7QDE7_9BACT|nr:mechanosensitive ion channel domain-containing protein [Solidesulfovibrio carbinoliphilus]EHJ46453.1 MscS Mechanosensitive ion channel [Solidesulfovibrio carbinoliphilus subsp. oakridgensis]
MMGDAAKIFGLSVVLALCVLATDAGPCFSRTGQPAPVLVLAAGPARHAIKAGDTLSLLAQRYGVPAAAILKANPGLDPARLQLGKEIVIPAAGRAAPEPAPPAVSAAPAPGGLELRPQKAPQATEPVGHDLPDAPARTASPPETIPPTRGTTPPPAETPPAPPVATAADAKAAETAAVRETAPLSPVPSVAVEKVGERTRIALGGKAFFADQILPWALDLGSRLLSAAVMFVVGLWLASRVGRLLARVLLGRGVPQEVVSFAGSLTRYSLYLVVLIACLGQLGLNITSLLALFGAAGLAVSLALKDTLANFASGIMLLLFRFFRVGDRVSLPGVAGATGVVASIDVFSTIIRSDTGDTIIVPNSKIAGNIIVVGAAQTPVGE